jgi:hypothetical protein
MVDWICIFITLKRRAGFIISNYYHHPARDLCVCVCVCVCVSIYHHFTTKEANVWRSDVTCLRLALCQ